MLNRQIPTWQFTQRACEGDGIQFRLMTVDKNKMDRAVEIAMQDYRVHGIMVYYPCMDSSTDAMLRDSLPQEKDVEGLCAAYRRRIYDGMRGALPYQCVWVCAFVCVSVCEKGAVHACVSSCACTRACL